MKKLLIIESQLEIYLRDNPLGTSDIVQAKNALEETVENLEKLVSQDKLGKVLNIFVHDSENVHMCRVFYNEVLIILSLESAVQRQT